MVLSRRTSILILRFSALLRKADTTNVLSTPHRKGTNCTESLRRLVGHGSLRQFNPGLSRWHSVSFHSTPDPYKIGINNNVIINKIFLPTTHTWNDDRERWLLKFIEPPVRFFSATLNFSHIIIVSLTLFFMLCDVFPPNRSNIIEIKT